MRKVGELLVRENKLTPEQLKKALEEQRRSGGRLGENLVKLGFIQETELLSFLSKHYRLPSINLDAVEIPEEIISLVSPDIAIKHNIVPVKREGAKLYIATSDPTDLTVADAIRLQTGYSVEFILATESAIKKAVEKYYKKQKEEEAFSSLWEEVAEDLQIVKEEEGEIDLSEAQKEAEAAPVIKLVNAILAEAVKINASDIHVEPYEKDFRIRFRVDGVLHEFMRPPMKLKNAITTRLKIMADMDIAEKRLPQDGRIKLKIGQKELDFRVNCLPTLFGEKIVLRLLDKSNLQLDLTKLGFEPEQLEIFRKAIHQPYGMVLVTGPTGSGKTTTLYSALMELNTVDVNISTAEDPVEYNLHGINQVQMKEEIGLNFANALRAFLRQDPDIILVGEIRDFETAEIGIKAALTGHLVLSTLHTNDAASTVTRLLNMGVEPFLVTATLICVVAQRLVRKICPNCKEEVKYPEKMLLELGFTPEEIRKGVFYRGKGCEMCNKSGYKGRIAIHEVLQMTEDIKELILEGASAGEIKAKAVENGMYTLRKSALIKILKGLTTVEEALRVTAAD